jgi:hypothetical protein
MNTITDARYFVDKHTFECVWKETPENGEKYVETDKYHSSGLKF